MFAEPHPVTKNYDIRSSQSSCANESIINENFDHDSILNDLRKKFMDLTEDRNSLNRLLAGKQNLIETLKQSKSTKNDCEYESRQHTANVLPMLNRIKLIADQALQTFAQQENSIRLLEEHDESLYNKAKPLLAQLGKITKNKKCKIEDNRSKYSKMVAEIHEKIAETETRIVEDLTQIEKRRPLILEEEKHVTELQDELVQLNFKHEANLNVFENDKAKVAANELLVRRLALRFTELSSDTSHMMEIIETKKMELSRRKQQMADYLERGTFIDNEADIFVYRTADVVNDMKSRLQIVSDQMKFAKQWIPEIEADLTEKQDYEEKQLTMLVDFEKQVNTVNEEYEELVADLKTKRQECHTVELDVLSYHATRNEYETAHKSNMEQLEAKQKDVKNKEKLLLLKVEELGKAAEEKCAKIAIIKQQINDIVPEPVTEESFADLDVELQTVTDQYETIVKENAKLEQHCLQLQADFDTTEEEQESHRKQVEENKANLQWKITEIENEIVQKQKIFEELKEKMQKQVVLFDQASSKLDEINRERQFYKRKTKEERDELHRQRQAATSKLKLRLQHLKDEYDDLMKMEQNLKERITESEFQIEQNHLVNNSIKKQLEEMHQQVKYKTDKLASVKVKVSEKSPFISVKTGDRSRVCNETPVTTKRVNPSNAMRAPRKTPANDCRINTQVKSSTLSKKDNLSPKDVSDNKSCSRPVKPSQERAISVADNLPTQTPTEKVFVKQARLSLTKRVMAMNNMQLLKNTQNPKSANITNKDDVSSVKDDKSIRILNIDSSPASIIISSSEKPEATATKIHIKQPVQRQMRTKRVRQKKVGKLTASLNNEQNNVNKNVSSFKERVLYEPKLRQLQAKRLGSDSDSQ